MNFPKWNHQYRQTAREEIMSEPEITPWLTPQQAAQRAQCSKKLVYNAVRAGKLKAARLGVRNDIRIHADWLDAWIAAAAITVNPHAPGPDRRSLASPFPSANPRRTRT
jgi:excisionase family DNA binding protein